MNSGKCIMGKPFMTVWWAIMGFSLSIPVALIAFFIGNTSGDGFFQLCCIIALAYVIFDIGKTFLTQPPSKIKYQEKIAKEDQENQLSGPFDPPGRLVLESNVMQTKKT